MDCFCAGHAPLHIIDVTTVIPRAIDVTMTNTETVAEGRGAQTGEDEAFVCSLRFTAF